MTIRDFLIRVFSRLDEIDRFDGKYIFQIFTKANERIDNIEFRDKFFNSNDDEKITIRCYITEQKMGIRFHKSDLNLKLDQYLIFFSKNREYIKDMFDYFWYRDNKIEEFLK